jgi:uncharacterized protein DUF2845
MKKSGPLKHFRLLVAVPFLLCFFPAATAFGLPCKGQLVNIGETMNEVAAKCGDTVFKETRAIKVEETDEEGTSTTDTSIIDVWTYDAGPEELVQSYRFRNGKLTEIRSNGYGTFRDFLIDTCRNGESLMIGDSTVETYLKCGEPLAKEKRDDKIEESESKGKLLRTFIPVVEWTYRYGPALPGYTVTFENGVATKIRTREFGK